MDEIKQKARLFGKTVAILIFLTTGTIFVGISGKIAFEIWAIVQYYSTGQIVLREFPDVLAVNISLIAFIFLLSMSEIRKSDKSKEIRVFEAVARLCEISLRACETLLLALMLVFAFTHNPFFVDHIEQFGLYAIFVIIFEVLLNVPTQKDEETSKNSEI